MSQRDVRHWLWDIRRSCDLILEWTAGQDQTTFAADRMTRSAVEREFEIIAEALKRVLAVEAGLSLRFPESAELLQFRNILAHAYHITNYQIVWDIIRRDVPALRFKADEILNERPPL